MNGAIEEDRFAPTPRRSIPERCAMSPSASCVAIPQYTKAPSNKSADADCFTNMDSALDVDLLAEYLLDDLGASGGFDFR